MGLKNKIFQDAGVTNPTTPNLELNDQGGKYFSTPKSSFAINETIALTFTNKIVEKVGRRLTIADGDVRPGTTR